MSEEQSKTQPMAAISVQEGVMFIEMPEKEQAQLTTEQQTSYAKASMFIKMTLQRHEDLLEEHTKELAAMRAILDKHEEQEDVTLNLIKDQSKADTEIVKHKMSEKTKLWIAIVTAIVGALASVVLALLKLL